MGGRRKRPADESCAPSSWAGPCRRRLGAYRAREAGCLDCGATATLWHRMLNVAYAALVAKDQWSEPGGGRGSSSSNSMWTRRRRRLPSPRRRPPPRHGPSARRRATRHRPGAQRHQWLAVGRQCAFCRCGARAAARELLLVLPPPAVGGCGRWRRPVVRPCLAGGRPGFRCCRALTVAALWAPEWSAGFVPSVTAQAAVGPSSCAGDAAPVDARALAAKRWGSGPVVFRRRRESHRGQFVQLLGAGKVTRRRRLAGGALASRR